MLQAMSFRVLKRVPFVFSVLFYRECAYNMDSSPWVTFTSTDASVSYAQNALTDSGIQEQTEPFKSESANLLHALFPIDADSYDILNPTITAAGKLLISTFCTSVDLQTQFQVLLDQFQGTKLEFSQMNSAKMDITLRKGGTRLGLAAVKCQRGRPAAIQFIAAAAPVI